VRVQLAAVTYLFRRLEGIDNKSLTTAAPLTGNQSLPHALSAMMEGGGEKEIILYPTLT
jgi:hypothetical protein